MSFLSEVWVSIKDAGPQEIAKTFYRYVPLWIAFVLSSLSYIGYSMYQLHQEYLVIKEAVAHHHDIELLVQRESNQNKGTSLSQITSNLDSLKSSLVNSSKALESLTLELGSWAKILESDINVFKSSADLTPFGLVGCDTNLKKGDMRLNNANPVVNVIAKVGGIELFKTPWLIESAYKNQDAKLPSIVIDGRIIEINHTLKGTIDGSVRKHDIIATISSQDYVEIAPPKHIDSKGCGLTLVYMKPAKLDNVNQLFKSNVDFTKRLTQLSYRTKELVEEVSKIGD